MASYSQRDQQMLTEAYSLQLLKESIPSMSLKQVHSNIDLMTESEAEYVAVVAERLLEAFFKNAVSGLKGVGKGLVGGAFDMAGRASQAVGDKVGRAVQGAKQIGRGVAGAAGQMASNVEDIYQTSYQGGKSADSYKKAIDLTNQLKDLLTQAQQSGMLGSIKGDIMNMSLSDVVETLDAVKDSWSDFSQHSQTKGIGGGVRQAFNQGRQSGTSAKQSFNQGRSGGEIRKLKSRP